MPKNYNLFLKGTVGLWDFSADYVNYVLDKHKDSEVHVLINSLGGDVATALSISSLFRIHGNVHCHFTGMNASAATIAAMGAKRVTMDADSLFLVHKCMAVVFEWDYMNADELAAHIAELEKVRKDNETIDGCIAGMYASRCKKPKDDLLSLMKKGAWLTAKTAKEWGFVDELTNNPEDSKPELTDSVASVMADAGIPLPPLEMKKGSFMERLFKFFTSQKPADEGTAPAPAQPATSMAKTLTAVGSLLGAGLAVADGKLTITEEQADKLEDTLAGHEATVKDLNDKIAGKDSRIAELEQQVKDLMKEPATKTDTVTEQKKDSDASPLAGVDIDKVCNALCDGLL